MQVVMKTATRSVYGNLRPGQSLDVDDNTGARWIKLGLAVAAEPRQPEQPESKKPAKTSK